MLPCALLVLGFLSGTLGACSSEPLASSAETGGSGGGGGSGQGATSGSGATGGSAGGGTTSVTDYTTSPCYGEPSSTEVYDLGTHQTRTVTATCRAEGQFARVYVSDELWQTQADSAAEPLDQHQINAFMAGYELHGTSTSFRPDLGVPASGGRLDRRGSFATESLADCQIKAAGWARHRH